MLPAWLLAWIFILIFGSWIVLNSPYFNHIEICLSQSRCSLEPKNFLWGLQPLNALLRVLDPPALLMLATLAFPLIMFAPGIISVFYLMFPAGFYDIHPGPEKRHGTDLFSRKSNILFGIPQKQQGCNNLQNAVELYNHLLLVVKNFFSVMVLILVADQNFILIFS